MAGNTCTCGERFRTAEDWRDHLPCPGTASEQEISRLRRALERVRDEAEDNLIAAIADNALDPKQLVESAFTPRPKRQSWSYYESHVTIEPVYDKRLELFGEVCQRHGFRVAKLLMKTREVDNFERSPYDSFCTSRSGQFDEMKQRMIALINDLDENGFKVWRYKIEDTLLDSRFDSSPREI